MSEMIFDAAPPEVATATTDTMPFHIWLHEVKLAAIRAGASSEWLDERFGHRLGDWANAGETVGGAVDMILFTLKREAIETRGEKDLSFLREFVHKEVTRSPLSEIARDIRNGTARFVSPTAEERADERPQPPGVIFEEDPVERFGACPECGERDRHVCHVGGVA